MVNNSNQSSSQNDSTIWSFVLKFFSSDYWMSWVSWIGSRFFSSASASTSSSTTASHSSDNEQADAIVTHSNATSSSKPRSYDKIIHHLRGDLIGYILDYLTTPEIKASTFLLSKSLYNELKGTGALGYLKSERLMKRFRYLITIEGEDNQNKAKQLLQYNHSDSQLVSELIVGRGSIQDAAGRRFENMSAYGYAFWAGDTRMRKMLETYMDEDAKSKAYKECKNIFDKGISFTFQGETFTDSKHFDFQPLLNAYQAYLAEATPLVEAYNWDAAAWAGAGRLWLEIGKEQAKVPTHVAQEYCAGPPFYPLPNFKTSNLIRTVKFYNWVSKTKDSWGFPQPACRVCKFSLYKGFWDRGSGVGVPTRVPGWWVDRARVWDMPAVAALCETRTVDDLEQTLENLKPAEPDSSLIR